MASLWLGVVALSLAGDPQCGMGPFSCCGKLQGVGTLSHEQVVESCLYSHCPLVFEILEPAYLQESVCVREQTFMPYLPSSSMDLFNKYNDVPLEVVIAGNDSIVSRSQRGCALPDFAVGGKNYTGTLTLVKRGSCKFNTKMFHAKQSGAVVGGIIDSAYEYATNSISGLSEGLENFSSFRMNRHMGDMLVDAYTKGEKIIGKLKHRCVPTPKPDPIYKTDLGPCPAGKKIVCSLEEGDKPSFEQCAACPLEVFFPNTTKSGNTSICLWGNGLLPRKETTLYQNVHKLPFLPAVDELVLAAWLPGGGCAESDYAGLAGKIVFSPWGMKCTPFKSVLYAQKHGVKMFVLFLRGTSSSHDDRVYGYSKFVTNISVHHITYSDTVRLSAYVNKNARTMAGVGYVLDGGEVRVPKFIPEMPVLPKPEKPLPEENSESLTTATIISIAAIVICVAAVVGLVVYHTKTSESLPRQDKGFTIPLVVASTGISVTLLVVVAIVAFRLTYEAAVDSTDAALEGWETATTASALNDKENTIDLTRKLRGITVNMATQEMNTILNRHQYYANFAAMLYQGYDGTWASFKAPFLLMLGKFYAADNGQLRGGFRVCTTNNFYGDIWGFVTSEQPANGHPSVATSNDGSYSDYEYGAPDGSGGYTSLDYIPKARFDGCHFLGGYEGKQIGSPLEYASSLGRGTYNWTMLTQTHPFYNYAERLHNDSYGFLSVSTPIRNLAGTFRGVVAHDVPIGLTGSIWRDEFLKDSGLEIFCVRATDRMVAYTNFDYHGSRGSYSIRENENSFRMATLHESARPRLAAMASYVTKRGGWHGIVGVFDQAEYYDQNDKDQKRLVVGVIGVSGGKIQDLERDGLHLEMLGGSCGGACLGYDSNAKANVIQFMGDNTLNLYHNLTIRDPEVVETTHTENPYTNRQWFYNTTTTLPDGTVCIADETGVRPCKLSYPFTGRRTFEFSISIKVNPHESYAGHESPLLFSDRLHGRKNVEIFANGVLKIRPLDMACVTKELDTSLPLNSWTTITAVWNQFNGSQASDPAFPYCSVFINGTLHSTGKYYGDRQTGYEHKHPYVIGHGFKGRMYDIRMYRMSLSEAEARSIHNGAFVREVPSKKYYATITNNMGERLGLNFSFGAIIPEGAVMDEVYKRNARTSEELRIVESNVRKELNEKSVESIMITIAIVMVAILVFLIFNFALTQPFVHTAIVMKQAAAMQIDQVPVGTSRITELRAMNKSMVLMLENLVYFKSYMPQSLKLDYTSAGTMPEDSVPSSAARSHRSGSGSQKGSQQRNGTAPLSASSSSVLSAHGRMRNELECSLIHKRFAFGTLNVKGWSEMTSKLSESALLQMHAQLLDVTVTTFMTCKGIAEVFCGDRFSASFNAARVCGNFKVMACQALFDITEGCAKLGLKMSSAVAAGDGRVGNMGTMVMRRFSFMSSVPAWCIALERYARKFDLSQMMCNSVFEEAQYSYCVRIVDEILFPKRLHTAIRVFEVKKKKGAAGDEWMYELQQGAKKDVWAAWNKWAAGIIDGTAKVCSGWVPFYFWGHMVQVFFAILKVRK